MRFSSIGIFVLINFPFFTTGLRCYSCDSVGAEDCIENPQSNGIVNCESPNDEYCYTSRLEETDGITFNRGCCQVKNGSPVCPPGNNFQIIHSNDPQYTKYMSRCRDDLCNDGDGTTPDGGGHLQNGNIVIVEGKSYSSIIKPNLIILFIVLINLSI